MDTPVIEEESSKQDLYNLNSENTNETKRMSLSPHRESQ